MSDTINRLKRPCRHLGMVVEGKTFEALLSAKLSENQEKSTVHLGHDKSLPTCFIAGNVQESMCQCPNRHHHLKILGIEKSEGSFEDFEFIRGLHLDTCDLKVTSTRSVLGLLKAVQESLSMMVLTNLDVTGT